MILPLLMPPLPIPPLLLEAGPSGYGVALLQTLLALAAVCVLAWALLRFGARRGLGVSRGRVRVLERVPLDHRRALYLVGIGERIWLIGVGDGGAPALLAELDPSELPPPAERPAGLLELMEKLRRPGPQPPA